MHYAVIQLAGKQYKVSVGEQLTVNTLHLEEGKELKVSDVLLVVNGDKAEVGLPLVAKASVTLKAVSEQKGDKVRVAKYKPKSRYRNVRGHRQQETTLEVVKISE